MTNEEVLRRYAAAEMDFDFGTLAALRHPDWTAVWPQSGEVIRGTPNEQAIIENYPGGPPRLVNQRKLIGSEDRWATSPMGGAYRVAGEGENWWGEWEMVYPDGQTFVTIILIELRDGKVWRQTQYWAQPFEAPAWRSQWVERAPSS